MSYEHDPHAHGSHHHGHAPPHGGTPGKRTLTGAIANRHPRPSSAAGTAHAHDAQGPGHASGRPEARPPADDPFGFHLPPDAIPADQDGATEDEDRDEAEAHDGEMDDDTAASDRLARSAGAAGPQDGRGKRPAQARASSRRGSKTISERAKWESWPDNADLAYLDVAQHFSWGRGRVLYARPPLITPEITGPIDGVHWEGATIQRYFYTYKGRRRGGHATIVQGRFTQAVGPLPISDALLRVSIYVHYDGSFHMSHKNA